MLILSCIKTLRGYLRGAEFLRIEKKKTSKIYSFILKHTRMFFWITLLRAFFQTHNTAD